MGLHVRAKMFPKYFKMLVQGKKRVDYRHIDKITFENTETGETATVSVTGLEVFQPGSQVHWAVMSQVDDLPYEMKKPLLGIRLGKDIRHLLKGERK